MIYLLLILLKNLMMYHLCYFDLNQIVLMDLMLHQYLLNLYQKVFEFDYFDFFSILLN